MNTVPSSCQDFMTCSSNPHAIYFRAPVLIFTLIFMSMVEDLPQVCHDLHLPAVLSVRLLLVSWSVVAMHVYRLPVPFLLSAASIPFDVGLVAFLIGTWGKLWLRCLGSSKYLEKCQWYLGSLPEMCLIHVSVSANYFLSE
jgi:hypothetical protein